MSHSTATAKTLYEKIWQRHLIRDAAGEVPLIYVDRHLIHEVTSPQAFAGLKATGRRVRCPQRTFATMDHNVSTQNRDLAACSSESRRQLETLAENCEANDIRLYDLTHPQQGIVHVIGPELGITQPGMVIVCGDSHTSTHGALGALAFGIGTSEVEHVLATQTLQQRKARTMQVAFEGRLPEGAGAKDMVLAVAAQIGTAGGTGHVIEFTGEAVRALSMEGRMTLCNMSIELGAKAGLVAPDATTRQWLKGREFAPTAEQWAQAEAHWADLCTDEDAEYDAVVTVQCADLAPQLTWGTNPGQVVAIDQPVPAPESFSDPIERSAAQAALAYMGLKPGQMLTETPIDAVFIGSCTNSRIEDLRAAAAEIEKRQGQAGGQIRVAEGVRALVVPGSGMVKRQAEAEGLDQLFIAAGFEWREPGCSMCLGMNDDRLAPQQRCASTSNRNFEGRQGRGSRTHLVSPAMAAAAALAGRFVDTRIESRAASAAQATGAQ